MVKSRGKYLWPLIGIVIFIVLIALYIDDRRKLAQEKAAEMISENAAYQTGPADAETSVPGEPVPAHDADEAGHTGPAVHDSTAETPSDPADDAHTDMRSERNDELTSAVEEHRGFSGSIEHYLSMGESREESTFESSSMSIDEYLSGTGNKP